LIAQVTSRDVEVSEIRRSLEENEKNYEVSKEHFIKKITEAELACSETIDNKNNELNQMKHLNEGLKIRLKDC